VSGDLDAAALPADVGLDLYESLIADLQAARARYRLVDHAPEGRTELVSALRGHDVAHAAKCLVVMVKTGKKRSRYVLAVIPSDARLDLHALPDLVAPAQTSIYVVKPGSVGLINWRPVDTGHDGSQCSEIVSAAILDEETD
jgi:hypothetical protein